MSEPVSVMGVGAYADAAVMALLLDEDLRETKIVEWVLDITRPDGPPENLYARVRGDRLALEKYAPGSGHPLHMGIEELRETFEAIASGVDENDEALERVRGYFTVVSANILVAMRPPGCGSAPAVSSFDSGYARAIDDLRWLAAARSEYIGSSGLPPAEEYHELSYVEKRVYEEVTAAQHVADILAGDNDGAGWLPSWKWDRWRERAADGESSSNL